ncbi:putative ribonuclease H-like domain-containing protein [Tanacetum coccineum]
MSAPKFADSHNMAVFLAKATKRIDQGLGSTSGIRAFALRNFDLEVMEFESAHSNTTAKLPILKLGEYEMWVIRIKQYFQVQDYALWEVIENGNSWVSVPQTAQENGTSVTKMSVPVTAEEKTNKKNDVKARSLLLMALPNEHQLTFSQYNDAKTMFAAIETRFGGSRRFLPPEWNTHVVVWMNKADIETMSIDDLYNNFKIVKQDVKKFVSASTGAQNLAFMTASSTSSTNNVNTANSEVSTVSTNANTASTENSTANLSDATVYAFLSNQPKGSQLVHEDLEQIHDDDLEEMDLKWQLALLSMRARRFYQRTGKKITINGSDTVGFDKFKVEYFNCHKMGHFARECRAPRNKEDTSSKAMLAIDGIGFDWSDMAEEQVQTNMALMAFSDSEVYNDKTYSKTCLKNYETLKKQCDDLIVKLNETEFKASTYKRGFKDYEISVLKTEFENVKQEKEGIDFKIAKFDNASKDLDKLLASQITDKSKKGLGYHVVAPPYPLSLNAPTKLDLSYSGLDEFKEPEFTGYGPRDTGLKSIIDYDKELDNSKENTDDSLEKEQVSDNENSSVESSPNVVKETVFHAAKKVEFVKPKNNEKLVKKSVRYAEMYISQSPRGNQRNWNGQKSNQLGIWTIEQIHEDDLEAMDLKWQLSLLSMRAKRYFQRTDKKIFINANDTARYDKSKDPEFKSYGYEDSKQESNIVCDKKSDDSKENSDDSLVKEQVSEDTSSFESSLNVDKEITRAFRVDTLSAKLSMDRGHQWSADSASRDDVKTQDWDLAISPISWNFDGGYVLTFGGGAHGGRFFSKGALKTNSLDFEEAEAVSTVAMYRKWFSSSSLITRHLMSSLENNLGNLMGKSDEGFFVGLFLSTSTKKEEISQDCIVMPIWKDASYFDSPSKDVGNDEPKSAADDPNPKEDNTDGQQVNTASPEVNTVVSPVNTASPKDMLGASHSLEATHIEFFSDKDEPEDELGNIPNSYAVPTTLNTRIHKDHPLENVIGDVQSFIQTRGMKRSTSEQGFLSVVYEEKTHEDLHTCLFVCFLSQEEPKRVVKALSDPSWVEAMQEELLQFKLQKFWILVDLPKGKRPIGVKWIFKYKTDERGIVIRNKARLVAQGYTQEEGIDYDNVFAPVARSKAIRLFLAYTSFMGFIVYQMDVKSAFLYGIIEKEVYVCQPPGFEDPDYPDKVYKVVKALYGLHQAPRAWYETLAKYLLDNRFHRRRIDQTLFIKKQKGDILLVQVYVDDIIFGSTKKELCTEFEKLMKDKFQMSSMGELTFFLGLQVKQKEDGIFISQDKYVAEILRKFNYTYVKTTSTPVDLEKPLVKDGDADDVDVHLYRSMIGSLMYLTSSRPNIIYLKGKPTLGLWYSRNSPFELVAYSDSDYAGATQDRKSTTGDLLTKGFDAGRFQYLVSSKFKKVRTLRYLSLVVPLKKVGDEVIHKELGDRMERAATTASSLEAKQDNDAQTRTTTARTSANGEVELTATIDGQVKTITESFLRRHLKLEDNGGVTTLPNSEIFEQLTLMGPKKTAWEQFSSNIATAIICLAINETYNFSKMIFDAMVKNVNSIHKFLMYPRFIQICLNMQKRHLQPHTRTHVAHSIKNKVFSNMKRVSRGYFGVEFPLFPTMLTTPKTSPSRIISSPSLSLEPSLSPQHTPVSTPSTLQPPNTQPTPDAEEAALMPHESPLQSVYSLGCDEGTKKLEKIVKITKSRRRARIVVSEDEDSPEDSSK